MKKFLSLILTVAILCTAFFQIIPTSAATDSDVNIWDPSVTASGYSDGDGTVEQPYIIKTGAELYKAINKDKGLKDGAKAYYKLANDIYLNDVSTENWYEKENLNLWFKSNDTASNAFKGSFDGDGYTVYGMYYKEDVTTGSKSYATGLFPTVSDGAKIENISVKKAYLSILNGTKNEYVGGLIGWVLGSSIVEIGGCSADETLAFNITTSQTAFAGGLIGYCATNSSVTIKDCYFRAGENITAKTKGGLIASIYKAIAVNISNSYCIGIEPIGAYTAGDSTTKVTSSVYSTSVNNNGGTQLTADQMTGDAAKDNMLGFDFTDTWTTVDNEYPKLKNDKSIVTDTPEDDNIWNGETADGYSEGEGTETKPYIIKTGAELYKAIATDKGLKEGTAAYYKLANDIYLNDVTDDEWYLGENLNSWFGNTTAAANGFAGYFDGDGYTIYGVYFKDTSKECAGLFPTVNDGAVIKNINLRKAYISNNNTVSATYTGGILGLKPGSTSATISGCSGDETVFVSGILTSSKNTTAGGLVGAASSGTLTIKDCYFIAGTDTVSAKTNKAGLIGDSWGTLVVNTSYTVNIAPLKKFSSTTTATHLYTNVEDAERANYVADANMKGAAAVTNMENLGYEVFYANDGYPLFRVNGERISDVNGDGINDTNDITAMRKYLLEDSVEVLACRLSVNDDEAVDIRDLVSLAVNANAE